MEDVVAERMTRHIEDLAKQHGVRLRWVPSWRKAEAIPGIFTALVPEIRRPSDYLFALHELGHIASPVARRLTEKPGHHNTVLCEGAAWAWATEAAEPALARRLTARDWDRVAYAYRTYLQASALNRRLVVERRRVRPLRAT